MRFRFLAIFALAALVPHAKCNAIEVLDSVVGGIANTAGSVARGVANTTGSVFGGIVDTTGSVLDGIAHTTGTVVKGTIDTGSTVVNAIKDTTKTAAGAIADTARTTWDAVRSRFAPHSGNPITKTEVFRSRNDVYGYSWTITNRKGDTPTEEPKDPKEITEPKEPKDPQQPSGELKNIDTVLVW